jgi:serine/threonine protein kinase
LTGEGVLLGTPDYMSPEQARDPRAADIRSDIYSLGCVLYHALAGQPPFPDTNIISQMIRHATEPPKPLKELNPAVPDGLQQIVNWMLAKDPGGRYPTPERAAQALEVFLAAGAESLQAPESDPKMGSYLSWLQEEGDKNPAAAPAPTEPTINLPPVPPARPTSEAGPKARPKHKPRPQVAPAAVKPPSGAAIPVIDVELAPTPAPQPLLGLPLTRRDFVVFGVGAGAGALATFLGCMVAVFGRRAPPPALPVAPVEDKKEN